jgi:hypothetical protein
MPLSEHEQRILDEIERRLAEEDPRLAEAASRPLTIHLLRRIRWSLVAFLLGFLMLMLFSISIWIAVGGFAVMVSAAMLVYHYLKQMGKDQLRQLERGGGRLSVTAALARLTERFRRPSPGGRDS